LKCPSLNSSITKRPKKGLKLRSTTAPQHLVSGDFELQRIRSSFGVMIMMVTLSVKGIPLYLRCSAFARAIEDDGGTIDVPASCYKSNTTIKDNNHLSLLLSTLRFWGVDMMPREVLLYIIWKNHRKSCIPPMTMEES
jgi:hypothetical protein